MSTTAVWGYPVPLFSQILFIKSEVSTDLESESKTTI